MITFKDLPDTSTPLSSDNLNTNFEELNRNAISVFYNGSYTLSAGNIIPFNLENKHGNKLTLNSGEIVIGSGVSKVEISAQIWFGTGDTTRQWFKIMKDGVIVSQTLSFSTYNAGFNVAYLSPVIVDVTAGQKITLALHSIMGTTTTSLLVNDGASPYNTMTYLTVKVIA